MMMMMMMMVSLQLLLLQSLVCLSAAKQTGEQSAAPSSASCQAWLVQSIPTDMPELPAVPGVLRTGDVLQWLAGNSSKSLDIMSYYWELLALPKNPASGDYGYSQQQLDQFGAPVGQAVYDSLIAAADRGVPIRIVQDTGFSPDFDSESAAIAAGRPNVQNRTLYVSDWWGGGVLHAKLWISNKKHAYVGSANNDWKSLTQVKELGIYFTDCPALVKRLEHFFENFWTLTTLNASLFTKTVDDKEWQINRTVPCWSHFLEPKDRCKSPLPAYVSTPRVQGYPYLADPNFFSTDEQGWVDTILSVPVNGTVRINTMDWLGQSEYTNTIVFWPALSSAIAKVVLAKHATVKVIVAHWAYTITGTEQYLLFLNYTNELCSSSIYNECSGKVEVKFYEVPGWQSAGPALNATTGKPTGAKFPDFTRVNHAKYVVSDVRANIGTSNLLWDYFYNTAGVSFGTYDPSIVEQLQAVFESDWNSPYAVPLTSTFNA
ncbi:unnamed protein product [Sphagnum jensenii]|uniref:PLD phosphodiesterase domain-containing protein n=1 Tax=Sphagnum jensenii TaxID=128206 RepID=A0ABP0VI45_9BRYO